jgi:N-acetylmuramoyl-L-alanine amidase
VNFATRLVSFLAVGLSAAVLCGQGPGGAAVATFVPPGGTSLVVRSLDLQGKPFLAVNDVLSALGGTIQFDEATFSYELKLKNHSAVVGVETPIAVVDTKLVSLQAPIHGAGSTLFADPEFFQRDVGPMAGISFVWDRSSRHLSARKADLPEIVVEVTLAAFEATTKVVLRLTEVPAYRVEKGDESLVLRFPAARLTASPPDKVFDDPRVASLSVRAGELHLSLRERGLATNVYALQAPPRIVIDVTRVGAAPGKGGAAGAAAGPPPQLRPEPKTIVLDAGHGGTEEGAKGPGGGLEKDATLALVKAIRETLVRGGYRVVTTRDSDATVGLDERPAIANASKPDLFLSIHCNASRSPSAHGTEVYYLSLDASDRAAAVLAEKENRSEPSAAQTAEKNAALRDLDLILWDLAQNQHLSASARLAEIIQADFNRLLGVATRGVKQAPFRVLIGVNVPAVLVEVAFITNAEEEKKLASEEFRRQVAETVSGSLATYFRSADGAAPIPPAKTR